MFAVLAATKSSGSSSILIIYAVLFAAFYFFYLRPRSKRQKATRAEARQVEVGQRAQTIGGLVGTVVRKSDDLVTLRSDSGVELDFVPSAIARRFDPAVPESTDDEPKNGDAKSTEGDDK
ncbi:MAG TPA: preprotein translocase subunit YajC [Acidimicrobiales bacterium]|nr:preprotein translocase subunit YajC [Acidimicrobiales bacterium]